jgi:hypothetical protein
VTDEARIASLYPPPHWTVRDGGLYAAYSATSAGTPPWNVYQLIPVKAFAIGAIEPYGATRWRWPDGR